MFVIKKILHGKQNINSVKISQNTTVKSILFSYLIHTKNMVTILWFLLYYINNFRN